MRDLGFYNAKAYGYYKQSNDSLYIMCVWVDAKKGMQQVEYPFGNDAGGVITVTVEIDWLDKLKERLIKRN